MLTARRCGGTEARSCPSSRTLPVSGISSPASRRSNVVLPQPEGPSRAKNSPGKMSSDKSSTAATPEKRLPTASNRTKGGVAGSLRNGGGREIPWWRAGALLESRTLVMRATLQHQSAKCEPDSARCSGLRQGAGDRFAPAGPFARAHGFVHLRCEPALAAPTGGKVCKVRAKAGGEPGQIGSP